MILEIFCDCMCTVFESDPFESAGAKRSRSQCGVDVADAQA